MTRDNKNFRLVVMGLAIFFAAILAGIFWAGFAQGQDKPTITISDLSKGGLNTNTNPFSPEYKGFQEFTNWDVTGNGLYIRDGIRGVTDSLERAAGDTTRTGGVIDSTFTFGNWIALFIFEGDSTAPPTGTYVPPDKIWEKTDSAATEVPLLQYVKLPTGDSDFVVVILLDDSIILDGADAALVGTDIQMRTEKIASDTGAITGVYSYYDRDGRKFLMSVAPTLNSDNLFSSLWVSKDSEYDRSFELARYIYKGSTPLWETWRDNVFIALPRQRALRYDGNSMFPLVPRAPGQVEVTPINTAGVIEGIVKYAPVNREQNSSTINKRLGYVSPAVEVNSEKVLLYAFPRPGQDSLYTGDSVLQYIARTKGYPSGAAPDVDSFYLIDSVMSANHDILDTLTFIDNTANSVLGDATHPFLFSTPVDSAIENAITKINDKARFYDPLFEAPGQPKVKSITVAVSMALGWWEETARDTELTGIRYFMTLLDTLTGVQSDSGPNLIIATGAPDSISQILLGLPTLTQNDSGFVRVLWRSAGEFIINISSTEHFPFPTEGVASMEGDNFVCMFSGFPPPANWTFVEKRIQGGVFVHCYSRPGRTVVSTIRKVIFGPFLPIVVITDRTQKDYADTTSWTTFFQGDTSRQIALPGVWSGLDTRIQNAKGFRTFGDVLFGWNGSRLFSSVLDSFTFQLFNDVAFNLDDGDAITQVIQSGAALRVLKNLSSTVLYDPSATSGLPQKGSQEIGIGCVAPHSLQAYAGKLFYLSADGVIAEQVGEFKDYRLKLGLISEPINDLLVGNRTMTQKKTAVSALVNARYMISYPGTDTTFVYLIKHNMWVIYDFDMTQATLYDNLDVTGLVKSSKIVFGRSGEERLYEFPGNAFPIDSNIGDTGTGSAISATLQTRPLFTDPNLWQIQQIGINAYTGTAKGTGVMSVSVFGKRNAFQDSVQFTYTTDNYKLKMFGVHATQFPSLLIQTGASSTDSLGLQSFHIWAKMMGRPISE